MNKRPIRHDFWIGTIWNRSRVNIALLLGCRGCHKSVPHRARNCPLARIKTILPIFDGYTDRGKLIIKLLQPGCRLQPFVRSGVSNRSFDWVRYSNIIELTIKFGQSNGRQSYSFERSITELLLGRFSVYSI